MAFIFSEETSKLLSNEKSAASLIQIALLLVLRFTELAKRAAKLGSEEDLLMKLFVSWLVKRAPGSGYLLTDREFHSLLERGIIDSSILEEFELFYFRKSVLEPEMAKERFLD